MDVCQEEIEFKWLDAAKKYEQELESQPESGVLAGESWQRIGKCYDLASRQVNNIEEFKSLRRFGVQAYKRAADFYNESKKKEDKGNYEFCLALAEYLGSWLAVDSKEKIENLDKSLEFGRIASSNPEEAPSDSGAPCKCKVSKSALLNAASDSVLHHIISRLLGNAIILSA